VVFGDIPLIKEPPIGFGFNNELEAPAPPTLFN